MESWGNLSFSLPKEFATGDVVVVFLRFLLGKAGDGLPDGCLREEGTKLSCPDEPILGEELMALRRTGSTETSQRFGRQNF